MADGRRATLRVMRPDDLAKLVSFYNGLVDEKRDAGSQLHAGFDRKFTPPQERRWIADTLAKVKQGEAINIIAEVDGRIAATGGVGRGQYKDTRHQGSIGLTVGAEFRGLGIGRKMIETIVSESRRAGLKMINVEFLATNTTARHSYSRAGFKKTGMLPSKIFRNGKYFDGLIMAKLLS